jgi:pilus assembly protein CpaF
VDHQQTMRALRRRLHAEVVADLDFAELRRTPPEEASMRLREEVSQRLDRQAPPLNRMDRERVVEQVLDEVLGLGPLADLLRDPDVSQIRVDAFDAVTVVRGGETAPVPGAFDDGEHLTRIMERLVGDARDGTLVRTPPFRFRGALEEGCLFEATLPPTGGATLRIERA